jgi:hypothetical protein
MELVAKSTSCPSSKRSADLGGVGRFDVEAVLRRHVVRGQTDTFAATANDPLRNSKHARFSPILRA